MLEKLGGLEIVHPIPNSFPQEQEDQQYNYAFMPTYRKGQSDTPQKGFIEGPLLDPSASLVYVCTCLSLALSCYEHRRHLHAGGSR